MAQSWPVRFNGRMEIRRIKQSQKGDQLRRILSEPLDQATSETLGHFSSMSPDFPFCA